MRMTTCVAALALFCSLSAAQVAGADVAGATVSRAEVARTDVARTDVASAKTGVWTVSRSPKLRVDVTAGCPGSLGRYQDVVNTFPGPPLVPSNPKTGIICRSGPPPNTSGTARLEHETRLSSPQASLLTAAVRRLNLAPPPGVMHCPADFGAVAVIGLSFAGRPDVGLWYQATGCQTLDNGRIGSFEGANPSFYNGFVSTIDHLSPPVHP